MIHVQDQGWSEVRWYLRDHVIAPGEPLTLSLGLSVRHPKTGAVMRNALLIVDQPVIGPCPAFPFDGPGSLAFPLEPARRSILEAARNLLEAWAEDQACGGRD